MPHLQVNLFGKFSATRAGQELPGLKSGKVQELFSYLLLHRNHPCPREALASLLWHHTTTAQSKAYLRRVLWKLRESLSPQLEPAESTILLVGHDWIQCSPEAELWLDIEQFQAAYKRVQGKAGHQLNPDEVQALHAALELYEGDLLENYYQEWCLFERERLRHLYLVMLDKITNYYQSHRQYEMAFSFAERILSHDHARERTHRQLMMLKFRSGDRTGALHQYERCVEALRNELDVAPSEQTHQLYEQIRTGQGAVSKDHLAAASSASSASAGEALQSLKKTFVQLITIQEQLRREIADLENHLGSS